MFRLHRLAPLLALLVVLLLPVLAHACPNCKNSLPDSDDPGFLTGLRNGYFWSYIGMSAMPFLALGTVGTVFYRRLRAAEKHDDVPPKA